MRVKVIGAGLAGCEAAVQLARRGFSVELHEMKPKKFSPAHKYPGFAELVCSNSLKAARAESACGLLKEEMRRFGSVILEAAERTGVPAGGALAVNREQFSDEVTRIVRSCPNIEVISGEVTELPTENAVICTGPLTSDALAEKIRAVCGEGLSFYDAAAPIVTADSIDFNKAFFQTRYDKGDADYVNCPMDKEEYERFYDELVRAESAPLKDFDRPEESAGMRVFEGCMPVEVLAKRGIESVRYGCMKPVGLTDPRTGKRPYAAVQLRRENREGTLYNLVGFQTNLKFGEQKRVFSLIPGLENAEFARYGVMHRNTFIDSPRLLDEHFMLKGSNNVFFGGQITGVEGYVESAASGIIAGRALADRLSGMEPIPLPRVTMLGALTAYISDPSVVNFQPMASNMGILPPLGERIKGKQERYAALAQRALKALDDLKPIIENEVKKQRLH
ncbi:MAG: methylenetetrahydrofolate--tRNA-(uracil(54)-C(5))-methyltransferase (FADH(2)-oxidizing) TrmFO [Oscillospiraceae bacterium]|nr:methylenetetrahydrofolate--tRNA-(uracil(54)-C(5))-methyltransferase (FADH(2)-oxidizing) TrmFO [Oscillospiraceae bacterium]